MHFRIQASKPRQIYIPIWLDLLSEIKELKKIIETNLHSNMVRFIILIRNKSSPFQLPFTFQYG